MRMVTPDGIVSTVVPGGVVTQPHDLDITHKGELVVTDAYQGVLHVFDLNLQRPDHIKVPRSSYTARMVDLLDTGEAADITFQVRVLVAGVLCADIHWQGPAQAENQQGYEAANTLKSARLLMSC